jgi:ABC-type dipeptide/oligopeptide/nickel transport system permease subunit
MSRPTKSRSILRTPAGLIGALLFLIILVVALFGGRFTSNDITDIVGMPGFGPSDEAFLGTDALGRDVWTRVLHGGLSVVILGVITTLLTYLVGLPIGLIAGFKRGRWDTWLMRGTDVLLAFPAVILILVFITALGASLWVLVVGVMLALVGNTIRIVYSATLEVSTRGYVEAAIARGERTWWILLHEILPSISTAVIADMGVRFTYAILGIAAMNYLGVGLQPPAADWGIMVSENQMYIELNPFAVLVPAVMLALLTISVNLIADAYLQTRRRLITS